jgi:hypothetical protein
MDRHDRQIGQIEFRIERLERRVVPFGDRAEVDLSQRGTVDDDVARLHAGKIDDRDDTAHHHRPLRKAGLLEFRRLQRRVGGAERHGSRLDLFDARARSDGLIVQSVPSVLFIRIRPFGVDRKWKGRSSAGNIGGLRDRGRCGAHGERHDANEIG